MENSIIGYAAATTSVFAFGIQFVHTLRSGTTLGLSFSRTVLDSLSLLLWVVYATRIEDLPLLIATAFEFITSLSQSSTPNLSLSMFCRFVVLNAAILFELDNYFSLACVYKCQFLHAR